MAKHMLFGHSGGETLPMVVDRVSTWLTPRPWITGCVVHVGTTVDPQMPLREGQADVAVELWTEDGLLVAGSDLPLKDATLYRVREIVEKGSGYPTPGPLPGVSMVASLMALPDLAPGEAVAGYDRHPLTALRVHIGMDHYVRHVTQACETPGADPYFGFSVLHYATDEDRVRRHYATEDGPRQVAEDVAGYLDMSRIRIMDARSHRLR